MEKEGVPAKGGILASISNKKAKVNSLFKSFSESITGAVWGLKSFVTSRSEKPGEVHSGVNTHVDNSSEKKVVVQVAVEEGEKVIVPVAPEEGEKVVGQVATEEVQVAPEQEEKVVVPVAPEEGEKVVGQVATEEVQVAPEQGEKVVVPVAPEGERVMVQVAPKEGEKGVVLAAPEVGERVVVPMALEEGEKMVVLVAPEGEKVMIQVAPKEGEKGVVLLAAGGEKVVVLAAPEVGERVVVPMALEEGEKMVVPVAPEGKKLMIQVAPKEGKKVMIQVAPEEGGRMVVPMAPEEGGKVRVLVATQEGEKVVVLVSAEEGEKMVLLVAPGEGGRVVVSMALVKGEKVVVPVAHEGESGVDQVAPVPAKESILLRVWKKMDEASTWVKAKVKSALKLFSELITDTVLWLRPFVTSCPEKLREVLPGINAQIDNLSEKKLVEVRGVPEEGSLPHEMKMLVQKVRKLVEQWFGPDSSPEMKHVGFKLRWSLDLVQGFIELCEYLKQPPVLIRFLLNGYGMYHSSNRAGGVEIVSGHEGRASMAFGTLATLVLSPFKCG
ncbi:hypothetical protein PVL29_006746 [Vitis rotundifolia]|uniref:Uncharacterized protein n=1 Tax=Vitis rotundifolia TaxID=103349 RepID=A0AA39A5Y9_VITRO|nr:hypothetical protein PVL29_006746 [Vitis rotundifolia]